MCYGWKLIDYCIQQGVEKMTPLQQNFVIGIASLDIYQQIGGSLQKSKENCLGSRCCEL